MTTTGMIGGRIADPDGQFIANTRVELVAARASQYLSRNIRWINHN